MSNQNSPHITNHLVCCAMFFLYGQQVHALLYNWGADYQKLLGTSTSNLLSKTFIVILTCTQESGPRNYAGNIANDVANCEILCGIAQYSTSAKIENEGVLFSSTVRNFPMESHKSDEMRILFG